MGTQKLSLKWKNHHSNFVSVLDQLLEAEKFVDVTLACEGLSVKAHKIVLSSCSNFFKDLFFENPCQHPIVILKDINYTDLKTIIEFMYHGKVDVPQDRWGSFLHTAETLKVKGLTEVASELGGQMGSPRKIKTPKRKRPQQQPLQDVSKQKQRKIVHSVVPVSLQQAKPSNNWEMPNQEEAPTVPTGDKSLCSSDNNHWDEKKAHEYSSSTSIEDSSSSNTSGDDKREDISQPGNSFSVDRSNISFFTAPISTLHSALEENSSISDVENVCSQQGNPPWVSSEARTNKNREPTIIRLDRVDYNNVQAEDDDHYILPTQTKPTVENVVRRKQSASTMLSALAKKASSSSLYAESVDKTLQVNMNKITVGTSMYGVERHHESYNYPQQDLPPMPVLKPEVAQMRLNTELAKKKKKRGRPRKEPLTVRKTPSTVRQRLNEVAVQKKKNASKILSKVRAHLDYIERQGSKIAPAVVTGESCQEQSKKHDKNDGPEEHDNWKSTQNTSETSEKDSTGKRERRPPKKLDSYIVGSSIPIFDETEAKFTSKVLTSPPKQSIAPKSQVSSKAKPTVQKKESSSEPIFAERGEEIHIGQNIWIEQSDWTKATRSETDRQFCNHLASCIWGNATLLECGVTGKALPGNSPKRPLTPFKVNVIKDRLTERLVEKKIVPEDISHRVKQVHKYLSDHILSLNRRRDRAFMKQRQQESL